MKFIHIMVGLSLTAIILASWNSDWFQKELFPKEYWAKQVIYFEGKVKLADTMEKDAILELKIIQATTNLQIAQEVNFAEVHNISREEARKEAVEIIRMDIDDLREEKSYWNDKYKEYKEMLKNARHEYSQY